MTDHRSPLDAALDLVLYAPVGLALTLSEELPKLAAKGRSGLGARVMTARVVGQFAVAQGRKEVSRRLGTDAPPARPATPPAATATSAPATPPRPAPSQGAPAAGRSAPPATSSAANAPASSGGPGSSAGPAANGAGTGPSHSSSSDGSTPSAGGGSAASPVGVPAEVPSVDSLAIHGYDSLSASQVVQRLAGLSGPELQAVKEYESASRGRRTILARVGQLQGH